MEKKNERKSCPKKRSLKRTVFQFNKQVIQAILTKESIPGATKILSDYSGLFRRHLRNETEYHSV